MFGGTFNKRACPIGVDVGSRHVRLMQLERTGDGYRAIAAASAAVRDDLSPGDSDAYHQAVTAAILAAKQAGGFVGKRTVSALPTHAVQCKNLRLPKMPAKDLASAVKWEANERLQLSDQPHAVQFLDAGEVRQGEEERQEVILLAAAEPFIERHVAALTAAGLTPEAVDVTAGALARCLEAGGGASDTASVTVDVGATTSKVLVTRGGRVLFFKPIDIGGRRFDEAAAGQLNMPHAEVAALRRQMREDGAEVAEHVRRAIREAVRPVVAELGREIGLCLRYYSVTFRGRRPEHAALVGGEAGQPWLDAMLTEQSGVAVATTNPLSGIDCAAIETVLAGQPAAWSVAAGLSMRRAGEPTASKSVAVTARREAA